MDISVVVPVYNEAKNIYELFHSLNGVLEKTNRAYQIIFVDDGSRDDSLKMLKDLKKKEANLKVIALRRNYGQTAAIDAGIKSSSGKVIITIDGDLQNDPQDIPNLLRELEKGYDVVSGWRYQRNDSFIRDALSKLAYLLREFILADKVHDSGCTLKAFRRECFDGLNLYGEMHRFIPAVLAWKGFSIGEVKVSHQARRYGKSKYSLTRVIKGFLDLLVLRFWMQYSGRPIHLFGVVGVILLLLGFSSGAYLTFIKLYFHAQLAGRPLLFLTILLVVTGVQFIVFGILADIMIQIYYGANDRRIYNIKETLE